MLLLGEEPTWVSSVFCLVEGIAIFVVLLERFDITLGGSELYNNMIVHSPPVLERLSTNDTFPTTQKNTR